ncbi:ras-related protein Rab-23-like [Rhopilema esculentum]|uniref:ras-related protein Rab-23-like n=1 Tax=Rhopilema esculentum TaxID=499914 RepID=UPI0031DF5033
MKEEDIEIAIKVLVVGNGAVGKSSMIQRYCKGLFTKEYKKTIGVDFLEKQISLNGEDVRLMLWDTAGQEEFDSLTSVYYRGAQACVCVFSTVDRASFDAMQRWKERVNDECGDIPMVLVQNKIDLVEDAKMRPDEAEALAKKLKLRFYRTSVKEDLNVKEVFAYLADRYIDRVNSAEPENGIDSSSSHQQQIGIFTTKTVPDTSSGSSNHKSSSKKGKKDTIQLSSNRQKSAKKKKLCFNF